MGKQKGKKRKTESVSDIDTSGNLSVSTAIGEANGTLYGTDTVTSTPMATYPSQGHTQFQSDMYKNFEIIMKKLERLEMIERKIDRMESRMTASEKKASELERSVKFVSEKIDDFEKRNVDTQNSVRTVSREQVRQTDVINECKSAIAKLNCNLGSITKENKELKDSLTDLKCRSMKNNLVFSGLAENPEENTEALLREFIVVELGIEQYIEFGNVHRFGKIVGGKSRPIVARFIYSKDREGVLRCARRLKGSTFYINEQFPTEIQQRRRELGPTVRDLRGKGKNVRLVRDKLIVDGRLYDGPIIKQSSVKERRSPTSVDTNSGNSVPSYSAVTRVNTSATSPIGARGHNSRTGNPHSTASSRHDGH